MNQTCKWIKKFLLFTYLFLYFFRAFRTEKRKKKIRTFWECLLEFRRKLKKTIVLFFSSIFSATFGTMFNVAGASSQPSDFCALLIKRCHFDGEPSVLAFRSELIILLWITSAIIIWNYKNQEESVNKNLSLKTVHRNCLHLNLFKWSNFFFTLKWNLFLLFPFRWNLAFFWKKICSFFYW